MDMYKISKHKIRSERREFLRITPVDNKIKEGQLPWYDRVMRRLPKMPIKRYLDM